MSGPRKPDWERPLTEVAAAVAECLAALDRYEAAFAPVLAAPPATRVPAPPATDPGWDARLAAARDAATGVEQLLSGCESAWAKWRGAFAEWHRGIEPAAG